MNRINVKRKSYLCNNIKVAYLDHFDDDGWRSLTPESSMIWKMNFSSYIGA